MLYLIQNKIEISGETKLYSLYAEAVAQAIAEQVFLPRTSFPSQRTVSKVFSFYKASTSVFGASVYKQKLRNSYFRPGTTFLGMG